MAVIDRHEEELIEVKRHKKRKPKINAMDHLPDDIETGIIEHDIENKTCLKYGGDLHMMEVVERKEIVIIPRKIKLRVHKIPVYGCRNCEKNDDCGIVKAKGPQLLFEKSPVSIETAAYLMDMKYNLDVPIHRIESTMKVEGLLFPRNTYARWMIDTADKYLMHIYEHMHKRLVEHDIIQADETRFKIYGEKGKKSLDKTYIWIYRTASYEKNPIIIYQYEGGRRGEIPQSFLSEFTGQLVTDDYAGYNSVKGATRCLCHAHARKRYVENIKGKGKNVPENMPELKIVDMYKDIFNEEVEITQECGDDYDRIKELRHCHMNEKNEDISVKAQLDRMYEYMETLYNDSLPGSKLYEALSYSITNKQWLYNFLEDGRIPMTNNLSEISIKPIISVRKSAIFFGSPNGARGSACIMTLIQTAKANGISPYQYIKDVLTYMVAHLDDADVIQLSEDELESLMPWRIMQAQVSAK